MSLMQYNLLRFLFFIIIISFIINFNFLWYKLHLKRNDILCNISMFESDQFLCESDDKWKIRKEFYLKQHEKNILTMNEYENYFSKNWFQEFQCQNEIRLGHMDGGKWVRSSYLKKR